MPRERLRHTRIFRAIQRSLTYLFVSIGLSASLSCGAAAPSGPPQIALNNGAVEVRGLSADTLQALAALPQTAWSDVLSVSVAPDAPAMLGAYSVDDGVARFTPAFPLDAGRPYRAVFDGTRIPATPAGGPALSATISLPAEHTEPTTVVTRIFPSSDTVPENILRMYIEFSAPMGRKSGIEYIKLLDHGGKEIPGAVLPLDYEFWSPDHTRFTVFFDPGRVKQGILPNREMGRAFVPGQTVTLLIGRDWRDEHGLPLKEEHRRTFTVVPADTRPLDPKDWHLTAPAAGSRDALVVTFPKPLDHSLLGRALGVRRNGSVVNGVTDIGTNETRWTFTPNQPWSAGPYEFLALDVLEDVAGNQVGRAFEVDNFDTVDKDPNPKSVMLPFLVHQASDTRP